MDGDRFQERVRYTLVDKGELDVLNRETGETEERRCYDFDVQRLELAASSNSGTVVATGFFHVFGEPLGLSGSRATIRQACIEVMYPGVGVKRPEMGMLMLVLPGIQPFKTTFSNHWMAFEHAGTSDMFAPI